MAPATVRVIQCHAGNVSTWNAWELEDAQGTVGKLSASSFEVSGSLSKYQGFRKSNGITKITPALPQALTRLCASEKWGAATAHAAGAATSACLHAARTRAGLPFHRPRLPPETRRLVH